MLVWVTGGAGFIGSHIADALVSGGHRVVVIDDLSTGRRENVPSDARFLELDLRDREALEEAFKAEPPEVVCHQAAQTSVSVSVREPLRDAGVNVIGGLNLLELSRLHGVSRFVFASTGGAIYGDIAEGVAADEQTAPNPISPYACSKIAFEAYLHAYRHEHGLESKVLRYANVYGPRQDPHGEAGVVAVFAERLCAGERIRINAMHKPGDDGCVRDYVAVRDVVRANRLAVEGELTSDVLNVGTGVATSTRALAQVISDALGTTPMTDPAERRAGDILRSVIKPNPELEAHGEATSLVRGIAETCAWFRSRS